MAQLPNSFDDIVKELNEDVHGMDIIMSQIATEDNGDSAENLVKEMFGEALDDIDEVMSQIDTEMIQEMEQVDANLNPEIPAELLAQYHKAMDDILPNRSGNRYNQAYEVFKKWQISYGTSSFDEEVVMAYFAQAGEKYKPSTLSSMHSMLKKTLIVKHNINIAKYCHLNSWLKKQLDGYQSKQSNVFTPEEISKFVTEAPNELYLAMKVRQRKL